ncbi:MAG: biotin transporter BioY [Gemmatimonadaceae bacterium]
MNFTLPAVSTTERVPAWLGVAGFAAALTAASQVALPLPFTPVPVTLQPFVVVLAGLWLGPRQGTLSMLLYIVLGVAGVPVWTPLGLPGVARLLGPTGGYIIAYPLAAFTAGILGNRARTLLGRWLAGSAGILVLLLGGTAQLAILSGGLRSALALGLTPFVAFDFVKAFAAATLSWRARKPTV